MPQQPLSWVALLLFSVVQRASSGPAAAPPASRARPCFLGRSSRRLFFGRCCRIGKQARPWHEPAGGSWLVAGGRLSVALSRGAQERRCCGTEPMQTMQAMHAPDRPVWTRAGPLRAPPWRRRRTSAAHTAGESFPHGLSGGGALDRRRIQSPARCPQKPARTFPASARLCPWRTARRRLKRGSAGRSTGLMHGCVHTHDACTLLPSSANSSSRKEGPFQLPRPDVGLRCHCSGVAAAAAGPEKCHRPRQCPADPTMATQARKRTSLGPIFRRDSPLGLRSPCLHWQWHLRFTSSPSLSLAGFWCLLLCVCALLRRFLCHPICSASWHRSD